MGKEVAKSRFNIFKKYVESTYLVWKKSTEYV